MNKVLHKAQHFKSEASHARDGVAVIFDIAGFSKFFNQPDVHSYIPKYLNHIIRCVEIAIFGGSTFWLKGEKVETLSPLPVIPVHRKFLGDGMLYVFSLPKDVAVNPVMFVVALINRLWNIQREFKAISRACADFVPVAELPTGIRFGIARGTIYELSIEKSHDREYVGVCLNLAARLQKYCAGLNFMASARLNLATDKLDKHGYTKVLATNIKGFPKEIVIVDKKEYLNLPADVKKNLFVEISGITKLE